MKPHLIWDGRRPGISIKLRGSGIILRGKDTKLLVEHCGRRFWTFTCCPRFIDA